MKNKKSGNTEESERRKSEKADARHQINERLDMEDWWIDCNEVYFLIDNYMDKKNKKRLVDRWKGSKKSKQINPRRMVFDSSACVLKGLKLTTRIIKAVVFHLPCSSTRERANCFVLYQISTTVTISRLCAYVCMRLNDRFFSCLHKCVFHYACTFYIWAIMWLSHWIYKKIVSLLLDGKCIIRFHCAYIFVYVSLCENENL